MILSGKSIRKELGKRIHIDPFNEEQLNPNSYNLRLHDTLLVYDDEVLDMRTENAYQELVIPEEGLILNPGTLYLGRTVERTETTDLVPMLDGRSSIGRLGLFVHITAGIGNVGAKGYWTLEMFCVQPLRIYAGVEICQVYFQPVKGAFEPYQEGKYQNNSGIQPSLLYQEFGYRSPLRADRA